MGVLVLVSACLLGSTGSQGKLCELCVSLSFRRLAEGIGDRGGGVRISERAALHPVFQPRPRHPAVGLVGIARIAHAVDRDAGQPAGITGIFVVIAAGAQIVRIGDAGQIPGTIVGVRIHLAVGGGNGADFAVRPRKRQRAPGSVGDGRKRTAAVVGVGQADTAFVFDGEGASVAVVSFHRAFRRRHHPLAANLRDRPLVVIRPDTILNLEYGCEPTLAIGVNDREGISARRTRTGLIEPPAAHLPGVLEREAVFGVRRLANCP